MKKFNIKNIPLKSRIIFFCTIFALCIISGLIIARKLTHKNSLDSTFYSVRKEISENCIEIAGTVSAADEQKLQALSDGTVTGVFVNAGD